MSRRERDASAQSARVTKRALAATDGSCAATRTDRARRLSEGAVVEASVTARLLRWKLLTLDASVLLLPANAPPAETGIVTPPRDAWSRRAATRRRLSDALRNLDQAEHELARARHTNYASVPQEDTPRLAASRSRT